MTTRPARSPLLYVLLTLGVIALSAFAFRAVSRPPAPTCTGNLHSYHDKCLTNTAIVYTECTAGRGFDTSSDISGSLGGTFKVVADASLSAAYKQTQTQNKDVSLQIVKDCLTIAGQSAGTPEELGVSQEYAKRADQFLKDWQKTQVQQTPHITLSSDTARVGDTVQVDGTNFYPGETVEIRLHATLLDEVPADGQGAFHAVVTVPADAPPPGFSTVISATGATSAKSADRPFHRSG